MRGGFRQFVFQKSVFLKHPTGHGRIIFSKMCKVNFHSALMMLLHMSLCIIYRLYTLTRWGWYKWKPGWCSMFVAASPVFVMSLAAGRQAWWPHTDCIWKLHRKLRREIILEKFIGELCSWLYKYRYRESLQGSTFQGYQLKTTYLTNKGTLTITVERILLNCFQEDSWLKSEESRTNHNVPRTPPTTLA